MLIYYELNVVKSYGLTGQNRVRNSRIVIVKFFLKEMYLEF